jgi:hypothetical protein
MINNNALYLPMKHLLYGSIFLLLIYFSINAQEMPPRPISVTVNTSQNLSFGDFSQGSTGGTVTVSYNGVRTCTGEIILLNGTVTPARFDVTANPGTLITIVNGSNATLNGDNGGTLTLQIGNASTGSPFITTQPRSSVNPVYIGGTLTVGNLSASPPGNYSGTFTVTFVQQ